MTYQDWFNILASVVGALGMWWLVTIWKKSTDLEINYSNLKDKLHNLQLTLVGEYTRKKDVEETMSMLFQKLGKIESLEMTVATHYVTKEDFKSSVEALLLKLDKIDEKLDRKADK
jgi:subtilisin-like proprotein convertase family protein